MNTNKILKAIGTTGMALTLVAPVAAPAIVQSANTVLAAKASKSAGSYSITINKYSGTEAENAGTSGVKGDGETGLTAEQQADGKHNPLGGITFTIVEVVPADGKTAADIKADDSTTYKVVDGTSKSLVTDKNGQAKFEGLGQGFYLIKETPQAGVTNVKDFVVSLPMTKKDGSINNDVQLYPKNYVADATTDPESDQNMKLNKSVSKDGGTTNTTSENMSIGDTATWTLNAHVPETVYNGNVTPATYGSFTITDPVMEELTVDDSKIVATYFASNGDGKGTEAGTVSETESPLELTTDYTITKSTATNAAGDKFNVYKFNFTEAGLKKVHGGDVKIVMPSTITGIPQTADGEGKGAVLAITNTMSGKATSAVSGIADNVQDTIAGDDKQENDTTDPSVILPKDPTDNTDPTIPQVDMGRFDISKYAQEDKTKMLADAEFTVYTDEACTVPLKVIAGMTGNLVSTTVGDNVVIKTDANGLANLAGYANEGKLYLKETKAPEGYVMTDSVFPVTSTLEDIALDAQIANSKDVFTGNLPITGSQLRIILMTIGSLMMVGCGAVLYIRKKKALEDK